MLDKMNDEMNRVVEVQEPAKPILTQVSKFMPVTATTLTSPRSNV